MLPDKNRSWAVGVVDVYKGAYLPLYLFEKTMLMSMNSWVKVDMDLNLGQGIVVQFDLIKKFSIKLYQPTNSCISCEMLLSVQLLWEVTVLI